MSYKIVNTPPAPEPETVGAELVVRNELVCYFRRDDGGEILVGNKRAEGVKPGDRVVLEKIHLDPCVSVWSVKR